VRERAREREIEIEREREKERERESYVVGAPKNRFRATRAVLSRWDSSILVIFSLQMCLPGRNTNYVPPSEKSSKKRQFGGKSRKLCYAALPTDICSAI
jgi:hypothetical protein